jgi:hypothetical protein
MKETKLIGVIGLIIVLITHVGLAIIYPLGIQLSQNVFMLVCIIGVIGWLMIGYYSHNKKKD